MIWWMSRSLRAVCLLAVLSRLKSDVHLVLRREATDDDLFDSMDTMMDNHSAEDKEILRRAHKILSSKKGMPKQDLINADVVADSKLSFFSDHEHL